VGLVLSCTSPLYTYMSITLRAGDSCLVTVSPIATCMFVPVSSLGTSATRFWPPDALQWRPDASGFAAASRGAGTFWASGRH